MNKKGLSPVIATVLLVALVLVLASIIYLWARAFIPEVIEKFDQPIENSCPKVVFAASYSRNYLTIQNNGNVPIYGVRYAVKKIGTLEYHDLTGAPIVAGASKSYSVGIVDGKIRVIPILLGKTSGGVLKAFACEDASITITA